MEYKLYTDTFAYLEKVKKDIGDEICVSFSGGKDSWVCLDLCCRVFKKVFCVFLYFIPGLKAIDEQLDLAKQRYGVPIIQYPHWALARAIKYGVYCDTYWKDSDAIWEYNLNDLHKAIVYETGAKAIVHGGKDADSFWRRLTISTIGASFVIYPIRKWKKFDVLNYHKFFDIPVPPSKSTHSVGADLTNVSILWFYDNYPDDYKVLKRWFPYIEAVVKRREFYGEDHYIKK